MLWVAYSILSRESWFIFRMGTENVVAMGSLIKAFVRKLVYIRMGTKSSLLWEAFVKLVCASRF